MAIIKNYNFTQNVTYSNSEIEISSFCRFREGGNLVMYSVIFEYGFPLSRE